MDESDFCQYSEALESSTPKGSRDKSDRATSEQVMDPRTRMLLFKLINSNVLAKINGCISTGKEVTQLMKLNSTDVI